MRRRSALFGDLEAVVTTSGTRLSREQSVALRLRLLHHRRRVLVGASQDGAWARKKRGNPAPLTGSFPQQSLIGRGDVM